MSSGVAGAIFKASKRQAWEHTSQPVQSMEETWIRNMLGAVFPLPLMVVKLPLLASSSKLG